MLALAPFNLCAARATAPRSAVSRDLLISDNCSLPLAPNVVARSLVNSGSPAVRWLNRARSSGTSVLGTTRNSADGLITPTPHDGTGAQLMRCPRATAAHHES